MLFLNTRKNILRAVSSRSLLSSRNLLLQILGALTGRTVFVWLSMVVLLLIVKAVRPLHGPVLSVLGFLPAPGRLGSTLVACLALWVVMSVVRRLTPIFSLRRQELRVTRSQIVVLLAFGVWLIWIIDIWNLYHMGDMLPVAIIGGVLGIMFQETIRSVVAFLYVRFNRLLAIGDWIQIPSQQVDGMVRTITLTSVTVENWDTTLSTFPTYLLQSAHFRNLQSMVEGRTYGRRMMRTFVVDTGWIQPVSLDDVSRIEAALGVDSHFAGGVLAAKVSDAAKKGCSVLNIELFRLYLHHWLMNHPHVSRKPRLVVRWLEQQGEGLPLQVYAYITDSSLEAFEWRQSAIIEHIAGALPVFNLKLYQSPSGYDASNSNIYLTDHEADYKNHTDATLRETL